MASRKENALLDSLIDKVIIRNDADLARTLKATPAVMSGLRNGERLTDGMRLRIMRKFGLSLKKIDELAPPKGEVK